MGEGVRPRTIAAGVRSQGDMDAYCMFTPPPSCYRFSVVGKGSGRVFPFLAVVFQIWTRVTMKGRLPIPTNIFMVFVMASTTPCLTQFTLDVLSMGALAMPLCRVKLISSL